MSADDWLAALVPPAWRDLLSPLFETPEWAGLRARLEACEETVYPPRELVFEALARVAPGDVRVVILGQDPYHGAGQAHGLAFSVPEGVAPPPSLRNIQKQVESEYAGTAPTDLTPWADQGVLLLNTCLTVSAGRAGSHAGWGWEAVTDAVISVVSEACEGVVFMLWGKKAQAKRRLVDEQRHVVFTTPHPSPLSAYRGFHAQPQFTLAASAVSGAPLRWL